MTTRQLQQQRDCLLAALRHIAYVSEGHHAEQPAHVLLHSLTIDIPDMARVAIAECGKVR